jgi:hypothetical protein
MYTAPVMPAALAASVSSSPSLALVRVSSAGAPTWSSPRSETSWASLAMDCRAAFSSRKKLSSTVDASSTATCICDLAVFSSASVAAL